MNQSHLRLLLPPGVLVAASLVSLLVGAAAARTPVTLIISGGTPISTSSTSINGTVYVPVKDVARALGMSVTTTGSRITLAPVGGANQLAAKSVGAIGEEIFTGRYRFQVQSVKEAATYNFLYTNRFMTETVANAEGDEKLVLVTCRLKNGTKEKEEYAFSSREYGENTTLTDTNEGSYQPAFYDVAADEGAPYGKHALPGSAIPFVIVFRVPKTASVKDLVFTVVRYRSAATRRAPICVST